LFKDLKLFFKVINVNLVSNITDLFLQDIYENLLVFLDEETANLMVRFTLDHSAEVNDVEDDEERHEQ
jgi:hypothetical protein